MKTQTHARRIREAGGALLVSMLVVLVIGISLGSYLALVSSQNVSVMRSLAWNSAVPAMEAGVEEALTQLAQHGITNHYFAGNGWALKSDGWYQKSVNLGEGVAYVARIQPVEPPFIVVTGVTPSPRGDGVINSSESSILAAAQDGGNFVRRSVRVGTRRDPLFAKGMVAKGTIDLLGNNVSSDSFDSENPLYSTGGKYDPLKKRDNGDIATNSGIENSLGIGNANIMGNVSTGPGGSVDIGANGTVGDKLWVSSGRKGIQPGHSSADMNVSFPAVEPPFTTGTIPPVVSIDGTDYFVLGDGDYYMSSMTDNVLVQGDARLYVSTEINMTGTDQLIITNGGSLMMYVAAPTANLSGKGILNVGGNALDFQYYGLPSNTSLTLGGNSSFTGIIYAPDADFYLGGGGGDTYDFVGSSITKTVHMNGKYNFHYDEALSRIGPSRGYIPVSWNEMDPAYGLPVAALSGASVPSF